MTTDDQPSRPRPPIAAARPLRRLGRTGRWAVLAVATVVTTAGLEALHLPAALLIGPMVVAIVLAVSGGAVRPSRPVFLAAQGVVGTMIATTLPQTILHEIALQWPVFIAGVVSTLLASSLLGWLMVRSRALPGTTAIWGTSPGAASVMTIMSDSYGADMRLVAFMQYLRVALCVAFATVVAGMMSPAGATGSHPQIWWPDAAIWRQSVLALAIAFGGAALGVWLKLPGGPMLIPMALAITAKLAFGLPVVLPLPVLALCYAVIGWGIGMRFTPEVIAYAAKVFPRVLLSILLLILICSGFAVALVVFAGIDPLTAFLATSPGGADSVAIISTSAPVDVSFVMSMQVARFIVVVGAGPQLARLLSGGRKSAPPLP